MGGERSFLKKFENFQREREREQRRLLLVPLVHSPWPYKFFFFVIWENYIDLPLGLSKIQGTPNV